MTLLEFVRFLRHNATIIALLTVVGLLTAAGYAFLQPVVYQSSATGIVVAGDSSTVGGAMSGTALAQQRAETYAALASTSAVFERAVASPEIQAAPDAGSGGISARVMGATSMIEVSATGTSGENARLLADAALKALADEALALETLTPSETGGSIDPDTVAVRLAVFTPASASSAPIAPDWLRLLLIGTAAGLVLGVLVSWVRTKLDVKVRTMKDVEEETGHSVLGVIPESKALAKHREGEPISISSLGLAGEALRQMRTNLRYVDVDHPPKAIVVTSAHPGEGKSTISSLLAVLVARSGQPVVLIDADLRKPVQHQNFRSDAAVGLSQVLIGDVSLNDALQATSEPNLRILTSGKVPANPSEMVGSRRMRELIASLSRTAFVIIDAPPMLAVTDAGLLAAATDGAVFVTRVGKTQREELRMAVKLVQQVGGRILGTVLHRAPRQAMGDVVYGAGFGSKYQSVYSERYYLETPPEDGAPVVAQGLAARATDADSQGPGLSAERHQPRRLSTR
ncbi:tyrosine-protein kinase domain-containing protein [Tessaracoccus sp. G1721]